LILMLATGPAAAAGISVVAEDSSARSGFAGGLELRIGLSAPTGFRVFTLAEPNRLVIDLEQTETGSLPQAFGDGTGAIAAVRTGLFAPGWGRIVADLTAPMVVVSAAIEGEILAISLDGSDQAAFDAAAGPPPDALWNAGEAADIAGLRARAMQDGPVVVAIDPGHGGIDPGAVRGGIAEKDVTLTFALDLARVLEKSGKFATFLTRETDVFVPLRERVERSRAAGADVMISIHVNTVETGAVRGATIYTLSGEASDASARALAEFENESDVYAGADYLGGEDTVALALIDLARSETDARSRALGEAMLKGLSDSVGVTPNKPLWRADLRVLKAPDMPSLLIELGFLSDETDRANIQSPAWRERAAAGVLAALSSWVASDRAAAGRLLQ
jgi:N-acetylmuramoyl-L-alanine amidase